MLHTWDLMGRQFVGLLVPTLHQLHMLSCDDATEDGKPPSLGAVTAILPGSHAVSMPELYMMVVLDSEQKKVFVYSGIVKVCVCRCYADLLCVFCQSAGLNPV